MKQGRGKRRKRKVERKRKTLEDRVQAIVAGRTSSPRRLAENLALLRRADRVDLLERIALAGPAVLDRCLEAALGSSRPHVFARNEARREVFARFAATSRSREFLGALRDRIATTHPSDAAAIRILARRLEDLAPARDGKVEDRFTQSLRLAAETQSASTVEAMLAVAVELDLLGREAREIPGEGLPPGIAYRIRRAQEALATQLARLGIGAFGQPGETAGFDPLRHEYVGLADRVASGMPVQLVTKGFERLSRGRIAVVQKAQVV